MRVLAAALESEMDSQGYRRRIKRLVENIVLEGDQFGGSLTENISSVGIQAFKKRLDATLFVLFEELDRIEPRENRDLAFKALHELISTVREVIDNLHNIDLVPVKQAHVARVAKHRKAARRNDQLVECILAEAKAQNVKMSKGIKFAHMVRPGVRQRMGLGPDEDGWPSASTIKAAVAKITSAKRLRGQDLKS
jgi:hypothetical protein